MVFEGSVCIFVCFCVSLDRFGFVLLLVSFVGFVFFQFFAKRLAGKNVSEMAHFVSSSTLNLAPSIQLTSPSFQNGRC